MIIDTHVHVTPPDIIKDYKKIGLKEPYFELLSSSPQNKFATVEDVICEMDKCEVHKSVVFGFSFNDIGLCKYVNDYVISEVKKFPDRLIGFMSISPNEKNIEDEILRCYECGLKGVGELFPFGQNFDIGSYEQTKRFATLCEQLNIPVIVHANEPVGHYYIGKTNTLLSSFEKFVYNYENLKIVFAHFGGGLLFYELMKEIRQKFKNVYYDTAASIFLYDKKIYDVAKSIGILDKIVFGSDFPLVSPKRYFKDFDFSVLSENTKRLLGI